MSGHRMAVAVAVAAAAPLFLVGWAAGPAQAHGAPTDPVSRVVACSPEGGSNAASAACKAAIAANGAPFTAWDNLRVAGVNGRDRQVIPDGKLCSGGLPAYKGLDLARADWPSTRLTPGGAFTLTYSSTIPHTGTFKLYLTKPGYDPAKPLTWSDLPSKPFATATDPSLVNGAYRIRATLPSDRTGRRLLYTIWQNSSTTDTYYSCSDVVLSGSGGKHGTAAPTTSSPAQPASPTWPSATSPAPRTPSPTQPITSDHPVPAADSHSGGNTALPLIAGGAAAFLLTTGAVLTLRRRR